MSTAKKPKIETMGVSKTLGKYQLGDCIGKGGFGSVYKALDMSTGGLVAIKQISVENLPESELNSLMNEIDLMKKLDHEHIVKYIGFERTKEYLNIFLEFCENGSLQSISKKFGKFPESLMSIYTSQVLDGLIYLHNQGVIHRDIKGANILTTKEGLVKLADFGVATKATDIDDNQVVGTPYWMAPEVIELSGVSTASDIWSVGCTIIELMTGEPPYSHIPPLSAMFRIVQDDHPPIPDGVSEALEDFLLLCFHRDPKLRHTAAKLKKHKWIHASNKAANNKKEEIKDRRLTDYNEAVKTVQEWNEALDSSLKISKNALKQRSISMVEKNTMFDSLKIASIKFIKNPAVVPPKSDNKPKSPDVAVKPEKKAEVAAAKKPATAAPVFDPNQSATQMQKKFMEADAEENWDDDFSGEFLIGGAEGNTIVPGKLTRPVVVEDKGTIKVASPMKPLPEKAKGLEAPRSKISHDSLASPNSATSTGNYDSIYSETSSISSGKGAPSLGADSDDDNDWSQYYEDVTKKDLSLLVPKRKTSSSKEKPKINLDAYREDNNEDFSDLVLTEKHIPKLQNKLGSRKSSASSNAEKRSLDRKYESPKPSPTRTIADYSEREGEDDYSDMFESIRSRGSNIKHLGLRKMSNSFWSESTVVEEEEDIFASLEEQLEDFDMDQSLQKDKRAKAVAEAQKLFLQIRPGVSDSTGIQVCAELIPLLRTISEPMARSADGKRELITHIGNTPVIDLVEFCLNTRSTTLICAILHLITETMKDDVTVQESLGANGAIPAIMSFTSPKYDISIRGQAALFISAYCHAGKKALQLIISSRSVRSLTDLLDDDYQNCSELVWIGVTCIRELFTLAKTTATKTDLSRLFMSHSAASKLALCFHNINSDKRKEATAFLDTISEIFEHFVLSDNIIRAQIASREVLKYIVRELENLPPAQLLKMLKNIRALSGDVATLDGIQKSGAIPTFIKFLERRAGKFVAEICSSVLVIMYNFCKISKKRQEFAASNGLVPHLIHFSSHHDGTSQLAMEMLCDFAHAEKCRPYLSKYQALQQYLRFLTVPKSYISVNALESIAVWLTEAKEEVEKVVAQKEAAHKIVHLFSVATDGSMLVPLIKIVTVSEQVSAKLGENVPFVAMLLDRLSHRDALIKLNLLKILKPILTTNTLSKEFIKSKVLPVMKRLEGDGGAVMVSEMASKLKELATTLVTNE